MVRKKKIEEVKVDHHKLVLIAWESGIELCLVVDPYGIIRLNSPLIPGSVWFSYESLSEGIAPYLYDTELPKDAPLLGISMESLKLMAEKASAANMIVDTLDTSVACDTLDFLGDTNDTVIENIRNEVSDKAWKMVCELAAFDEEVAEQRRDFPMSMRKEQLIELESTIEALRKTLTEAEEKRRRLLTM